MIISTFKLMINMRIKYWFWIGVVVLTANTWSEPNPQNTLPQAIDYGLSETDSLGRAITYYQLIDTIKVNESCDCKKSPGFKNTQPEGYFYGQSLVAEDSLKEMVIYLKDTLKVKQGCQCPTVEGNSNSRFNRNNPNNNLNQINLESGASQSWNHVVTTGVFIEDFGKTTVHYTAIYNYQHALRVGAGIGSKYGSGYGLDCQYSYMLSPFYEDPSVFGVRLGYRQASGETEIGEEGDAEIKSTLSKVDVWGQALTLGVNYGHWYQWESGFTMQWQIGVAYPLSAETHWVNSNFAKQSFFKEETEGLEKSITVLNILSGTGLSLGWTF